MYHGSEEETDYATSHMVHADRWSLWHWSGGRLAQYSSAPRYLELLAAVADWQRQVAVLQGQIHTGKLS